MNWQESDDGLWPAADYADDEVFQWLQAEQNPAPTATSSADPQALVTALTALNQALATLNSSAVAPSREDYSEPEQGEVWGAIIGAVASAVPAIVNLIGQATSSRRRAPARRPAPAPRPAPSPRPAASPPPAPAAAAAPATPSPVASAPATCRCPPGSASGEWLDEGQSSEQAEAVAAVVPLLTQLLPVILQLLPVALQAGGQAAGALAQHGPALANMLGSLSGAIPVQAPAGGARPSTGGQRPTREMEGNPVYLEYQP